MTWQTGSALSDIWSVRQKLRMECGRCLKWPPGRRSRFASARRGEAVCSSEPHAETHTPPSTFLQLTHDPRRNLYSAICLLVPFTTFLASRVWMTEKIFIENQVCVNTSPPCHFIALFFLFTSISFFFSARKTD